ncbi:4-hydroxy-2-oxoheptanedioate aldolase [Planifilum fulgidum]|jgi:2-keto-3-deoxy-L-rhamnonate aldolase RhmA|uniref:4-hydroxy-2-oxoheptanedioate aldolase n=1 Tax=Planifilum fulgidum TaxID=201973 RepID=A0A1I2KBB7_9BACL|nr:aldolase/citrate lyase family protein [Planifilum fulgidum]SFF63608.1 4-hydroxy-2-oxoheptanedioate aldolase [Planifilum fulgidum]
MLKEKLASKGAVFGTWIRIPHPMVVEAIAAAGFDFVHLDQEHGPIGTAELDQLILAAKASGIPAVVRVPGKDGTRIGQALDLGAEGVIIPHVASGEDVRSVVRAGRFHPRGMRGVAGGCRADGYGTLPFAEVSEAADRRLILVQIESKEAVERLDEILDASGDSVDVYYIGPADLSQSLGIPCQFDHPLLGETIRRITERLRARGKTVGIHAPTADHVVEYAEMGIRYITCSMDIVLLASRAQALAAEWREALKGLR